MKPLIPGLLHRGAAAVGGAARTPQQHPEETSGSTSNFTNSNFKKYFFLIFFPVLDLYAPSERDELSLARCLRQECNIEADSGFQLHSPAAREAAANALRLHAFILFLSEYFYFKRHNCCCSTRGNSEASAATHSHSVQ